MRLVLPFSFVILSFFAISAGWTWRKRYISRPPVLALLLVPLIPFAIAVLTAIYHYFHRTIIGAVLLAADFTPTLIVVLLLQALLLLVSLALMAGQSTS
jgi:uncharacterized membrane protein